MKNNVEMWEIYCILDKTNGYRYIGQTKTGYKNRYSEHIYSVLNTNRVDSNYLIHRVMREKGIDNFDIIMLESNIMSQHDANILECQYINKYNTYINAEPCFGYNVRPGGSGNDSNGTEVHVYSLSGEYELTFKSVAMAARNYDINPENIFYALDKRYKTSHNKQWRTFKASKIDDLREIKNYLYSIKVYDKNNNLMGIFDTVTEAADKMGVDRLILYSALNRGQRGSCYSQGYKWIRYDSDATPEEIIVYSDKEIRAVNLYKIDGDIGVYQKTYNNGRELALEFSTSHSAILNIAKGLYGHNQYKQYIIMFDTVDNRTDILLSNEIKQKHKKKGRKPVRVTDLQGNILFEFRATKWAAEHFDVSNHKILELCTSNKAYKNMYFSYIEEY